VANEQHLAKLREGVEKWNRWRNKNPEVRPDLSRTKLMSANLSGASLMSANLSNADLSGAHLSNADLIGAHLFDANLNRADLSSTNLISANLSRANLISANLSRANLRNANLSRANLRDANLSSIHAIATSLLGSNLTNSILTGACIQDWNINSATQLDRVRCDDVYLKAEWSEEELKDILSERRPSNPNAVFAPGEFQAFVQKALSTVDLIFADGIDWKAFFQSFQEFQSQYDEESLSIQAIEKKSSGAFVIRLEVPLEADKAAIEVRAKELYERDRQLLEAQYRERLQAKDQDIEKYKQENTNLWEVVKLQASKPITVEAKAVVDQSNPKTYNNDNRGAKIGNFANSVEDNARQQTNQHNYESPEKRSLAEAATEIQRLLKVLEETNPTATEADKKNFVSLAVSPTLKQRAFSALQSAGKTALEEFLDNPYVNVGVAIVEGWREPK
jgi:uncharacterized protein YjbI with pentapeptide repeats